jgi:hypothetical protein
MSEAIRIGAGGLRALGKAYLCRRYAILFYTPLLTMVAVPLVAAFELSGGLVEFFLAASLLAGVMPVTTAVARGLATVEGVGGQLFLAVMVGQLFPLPRDTRPDDRGRRFGEESRRAN